MVQAVGVLFAALSSGTLRTLSFPCLLTYLTIYRTYASTHPARYLSTPTYSSFLLAFFETRLEDERKGGCFPLNPFA